MITVYHLSIPMRVGFVHARATRKRTDNVVVRLELPDGRVGWGEGVPREYVTGETVESALARLRDFDLRHLSRFEGASFQEVASELWKSSLLPLVSNGSPAHAAACALEVALLDAVARSEDKKISEVLDVIPELRPLKRSADLEMLRVSIPIGGDVTSMLPLFERLDRTQRFDIKVKVGFGVREDAERVEAVRHAFGDLADIRVDANGSWTLPNALESLNAMKPHALSAVEEPVADKRLDDAARLRESISIPVMLDESVCSLADAEAAVDANAMDMVNLRISKCGGVIEMLRIARFAKDARVACQLGCMVGETGILASLERQLAGRLEGIRYLETSCNTLTENIVAEPITADGSRRTRVPSSSGFGATVVPELVAKYTVFESSRNAP